MKTTDINCPAQVTRNGRVIDELDPGVEARYRLNDLFSRAWLGYAVSALAKHKVFDSIGSTPVSAGEVADKRGLHAATLYRVLRALAANGILDECGTDMFQQTPVSQLLRSDNPYSWRGMALMWNHSLSLHSWEKFSEVLTDGHSGVEHAYGKRLYDCLHDDADLTNAFSDAMTSNSAHPSMAIARAFPFQDHSSVLDLGGGTGLLLASILHEHPSLTGAVLEISDLKNGAENFLAEQGLLDRARVEIGDFIQSVPDGFDVYIVKNSLWNWNDEECLVVMQNVRFALGDCSQKRFIIVEYVIDEQNASWTTAYDLQILNLPGGRARTLKEYSSLLTEAGFELERVTYAQDQQLLIAKPV